MKVLHVTQNYEPSIGGTQYMIKKVSENLVNVYDDTVTVFTTNSYYGPNRNLFLKIDKEEEIIEGVQVKRFPFLRIHKPLLKYYSSIIRKPIPSFLYRYNTGPVSRSLRKAIVHYECDIICASSIEYLFGDYPYWENERKKPFVLYGGLHLESDKHIHGDYLKRIRSADHYIANTEFEKKVLVGNSIKEDKIAVIGCGTDIFRYDETLMAKELLRKKYGIPPDHAVLLYLGRQESLKGIDCLITAVENLCKEDRPVCLIIGGARGSYSEQLQKVLQTHSAIHLLENIPETVKAELLKLCDILVLPSKYESFGIVFLEAWSFKKPVIGADIGAVASVISNGKDGLLFTAGDANDLAKKIKTLLESDTLRCEMGSAGYSKVMQYYTWPIIVSKFRQVYERAIENFKS
jgi:glycosyltransferase involved in cell wall biosynthesis